MRDLQKQKDIEKVNIKFAKSLSALQIGEVLYIIDLAI